MNTGTHIYFIFFPCHKPLIFFDFLLDFIIHTTTNTMTSPFTAIVGGVDENDQYHTYAFADDRFHELPVLSQVTKDHTIQASLPSGKSLVYTGVNDRMYADHVSRIMPNSYLKCTQDLDYGLLYTQGEHAIINFHTDRIFNLTRTLPDISIAHVAYHEDRIYIVTTENLLLEYTINSPNVRESHIIGQDATVQQIECSLKGTYLVVLCCERENPKETYMHVIKRDSPVSGHLELRKTIITRFQISEDESSIFILAKNNRIYRYCIEKRELVTEIKTENASIENFCVSNDKNSFFLIDKQMRGCIIENHEEVCAKAARLPITLKDTECMFLYTPKKPILFTMAIAKSFPERSGSCSKLPPELIQSLCRFL